MEKDPLIRLADISEYTMRRAAATVEGAETQLRTRLLPNGPVLKTLPRRSAWSTLQQLVREAQKRAERRRATKDSRKRKLSEVFISPSHAAALDDAADVAASSQMRPGQQRSLALERAGRRLASHSFSAHMEALTDLLRLEVMLEEARTRDFLHMVQALSRARETQLPLRMVCRQLLSLWKKSKAAAAEGSPHTPKATIGKAESSERS